MYKLEPVLQKRDNIIIWHYENQLGHLNEAGRPDVAIIIKEIKIC